MTTISQNVLFSNKTVSISNSAVPHMAYNVCKKTEQSPSWSTDEVQFLCTAQGPKATHFLSTPLLLCLIS